MIKIEMRATLPVDLSAVSNALGIHELETADVLNWTKDEGQRVTDFAREAAASFKMALTYQLATQMDEESSAKVTCVYREADVERYNLLHLGEKCLPDAPPEKRRLASGGLGMEYAIVVVARPAASSRGAPT